MKATILLILASIVFSLAEPIRVRAIQQPTVQARAVRPAAVSGDLLDINLTIDGLETTRAYARANYNGVSVTVDVGSLQNIIGVVQDHGRWPTHFPGRFRVEVSTGSQGPWLGVAEEEAKRGENRTLFEAVRGRYIRITATRMNQFAQEWSIAELRAIVDPGATPRVIGSRPDVPGRPLEPVRPSIRDFQLALDRNPQTRATSGTADYRGISLTLDLGGEYQISRVVQLHGRWPDEYPAEYKVEVSRRRDEDEFREVWRGAGERDRSIARFNEVTTRYIKLTALRERGRGLWWSIAELRTNRDEEEIVEVDPDDGRIERPIRNITAEGIFPPRNMTDDNQETAAQSRGPNYIGSQIQADLGGSYTISRVVQVHVPNSDDFARRYRVEISEDGARWRSVWEGPGERNRSRATFTPVRARYVRITALANRENRRWSVSTLRITG